MIWPKYNPGNVPYIVSIKWKNYFLPTLLRNLYMYYEKTLRGMSFHNEINYFLYIKGLLDLINKFYFLILIF